MEATMVKDNDDAQWCECGQPKAARAECCDRCSFLDGENARARVIAALRTLVHASVYEVAEFVCMTVRYTHTLLTALIKNGRARSVQIDYETYSDELRVASRKRPPRNGSRILTTYELVVRRN